MKQIKLFSDGKVEVDTSKWPRSLRSIQNQQCAECSTLFEDCDCILDNIRWDGRTWYCGDRCLDAYLNRYGLARRV